MNEKYYKDVPESHSLDSMEGEENEKVSLLVSPDSLIPNIDLSKVTRDSRVGTIRAFGRNDQLNYSSYAIDAVRVNDQDGERLAHLKKFFEGRPVVDLGAGKDTDAYKLACLLGASGYIAVEPFSHEDLQANLLKVSENKIKLNVLRKDGNRSVETEIEADPIKFSVVPVDVLGFIGAIPDNSVNIFSFGVDETILKDTKYIDLADKEVSRVLSESGAYIGEETVLQPAVWVEGEKDFINDEMSTDTYGMKIVRYKK